MSHAGLLYHWALVSSIVWSECPCDRGPFIHAPRFACGLRSRLAARWASHWPSSAEHGEPALFALRRSVLSRSEAELAREQERQRIAADFHDGPLQSFIGFQMRLEIIRKLMGGIPKAQCGNWSAAGPRPGPGNGASGICSRYAAGGGDAGNAAIRRFARQWSTSSGTAASRRNLFCGDLSRLDESMTLEVLQIVRESSEQCPQAFEGLPHSARSGSDTERATWHPGE